MKKIILILLLILNFEAWAIEHKSLSCSKNGTYIISINGINVKENMARNNATHVSDLIINIKDRIDNKEFVQVIPEYNSSEGLFRDAYQLIKQKLAGQKRFSDEKILDLIPLFFFKIWEFQDEVGTEMGIYV